MNTADLLKLGLMGAWGLFLAPPAAAQEMYKWADDEGRFHYSPSQPETAGFVEKVHYAEEQWDLERQKAELDLAKLEVTLGKAVAGSNDKPGPGSYGHWWIYDRSSSRGGARQPD
jgi:hypothetical protein